MEYKKGQLKPAAILNFPCIAICSLAEPWPSLALLGPSLCPVNTSAGLDSEFETETSYVIIWASACVFIIIIQDAIEWSKLSVLRELFVLYLHAHPCPIVMSLLSLYSTWYVHIYIVQQRQ